MSLASRVSDLASRISSEFNTLRSAPVFTRYGDQLSMVMRRANGTAGSPTTVALGDVLASLAVHGWDGGAWRNVAGLAVWATDDPAGGEIPGCLALLVGTDEYLLLQGGSINPVKELIMWSDAGGDWNHRWDLGSGLLPSTIQGVEEYDGALRHITPNGSSGRAAYLAAHQAYNNSALNLTSGTTEQSIFGKALNVPTGTYLLDGIIRLTTGGTSHTEAFRLAGTATIATNPLLAVHYLEGSTGTGGTPRMTFVSPGTATIINAASTQTTRTFTVRGMVRVTAAGTLDPSIKFSAAPGGTNQVLAYSYLSLIPVPAAGFHGAWA